jgi:outer membrane protein assembly factor BamD (BamD/ComL family)
MEKRKKSRKELLKSPDEFLTFSGKVVLFVTEHSKHFRMAGSVLAAAVLIYVGITTYLHYLNKKGQTAYNTAYYELVKELNQRPEKRELKKPEALFEGVIEGYGHSKVSRLAPPQLAYLKFQEKKYDEAVSFYNAFLKEVADRTYQSLARLAIAACYEEKGELANCIEVLKEITTGSSIPFKDQAMLSLARAYRLSNQNEKAKETLREFVEIFPNSPFLPVAKGYMSEFNS